MSQDSGVDSPRLNIRKMKKMVAGDIVISKDKIQNPSSVKKRDPSRLDEAVENPEQFSQNSFQQLQYDEPQEIESQREKIQSEAPVQQRTRAGMNSELSSREPSKRETSRSSKAKHGKRGRIVDSEEGESSESVDEC